MGYVEFGAYDAKYRIPVPATAVALVVGVLLVGLALKKA